MENLYCQSCGMPMNTEDLLGTNTDGSRNNDYCTYCYRNGAFIAPDMTMEQMIEICVPHMVEGGMDGDEARKMMKQMLPNLKRWQSK